jgi:prolipoprotein diacylglyceryl transferase
MYPTLYHAVLDLTGLSLPFLKLFMTFGFFVALSFVAAYTVMKLELKRKEDEPGMEIKKVKEVKGGPASIGEYASSAFFGFILGWKVPRLITDFSELSNDFQGYLLSTEGDILFGILGAAAFVGYLYYQNKKERLEDPIEEIKPMRPHEHMGELTIKAAIFGIIGAKVFHLLEYPEQFMDDPIGSLISFSGLTFLGGLAVGGWAVVRTAKKRGIPPLKMLDVGGPAMMLAYAVGRMGCHFSGDGDWGIVNTSPKPGWMSFLPDWMWSYNYPNNVIRQCNPYQGAEALEHPCSWAETPYLIDPVFPTPFYEIVMGLILFSALWVLRKRIRWDGALFGIYLIFAGIERFLIEKIRVNSTYELAGLEFTQAELLSLLMILGGTAMIIWAVKRRQPEDSVRTKPDGA